MWTGSGGRWQGSGGRWQVAGGRWQVATPAINCGIILLRSHLSCVIIEEKPFSLATKTKTKTKTKTMKTSITTPTPATTPATPATGRWMVRDSYGVVSELDPAYFGRSFRPMRWMTAAHIAAARKIADGSMAIGETVTLARDFHPRHGVKERTLTRVA